MYVMFFCTKDRTYEEMNKCFMSSIQLFDGAPEVGGRTNSIHLDGDRTNRTHVDGGRTNRTFGFGG